MKANLGMEAQFSYSHCIGRSHQKMDPASFRLSFFMEAESPSSLSTLGELKLIGVSQSLH